MYIRMGCVYLQGGVIPIYTYTLPFWRSHAISWDLFIFFSFFLTSSSHKMRDRDGHTQVCSVCGWCWPIFTCRLVVFHSRISLPPLRPVFFVFFLLFLITSRSVEGKEDEEAGAQQIPTAVCSTAFRSFSSTVVEYHRGERSERKRKEHIVIDRRHGHDTVQS